MRAHTYEKELMQLELAAVVESLEKGLSSISDTVSRRLASVPSLQDEENLTKRVCLQISSAISDLKLKRFTQLETQLKSKASIVDVCALVDAKAAESTNKFAQFYPQYLWKGAMTTVGPVLPQNKRNFDIFKQLGFNADCLIAEAGMYKITFVSLAMKPN